MIDGIPNRPLSFSEKDSVGWFISWKIPSRNGWFRSWNLLGRRKGRPDGIAGEKWWLNDVGKGGEPGITWDYGMMLKRKWSPKIFKFGDGNGKIPIWEHQRWESSWCLDTGHVSRTDHDTSIFDHHICAPVIECIRGSHGPFSSIVGLWKTVIFYIYFKSPDGDHRINRGDTHGDVRTNLIYDIPVCLKMKDAFKKQSQ